MARVMQSAAAASGGSKLDSKRPADSAKPNDDTILGCSLIEP